MRRRAVHIWWAVLGVAAAGVACVWLLIHFNLLPMRSELWMDLYTGNLSLHSSCCGITVQVKPRGNFSSGMAPGGNLASYEDPQNREEWVMVVGSMQDFLPYPAPSNPLSHEQKWELFSALGAVARSIDKDPVPGFKYDPPNGYTRDCKRQLLLNCLRIARETRNAGLIGKYYYLTVETLRPLEHKANAVELPSVDEFLATHKSPAGG